MPVKRAGIKTGYDPAIARQAICCADVHNNSMMELLCTCTGLRENHQYQYYRRVFNATTSVDKATILHFGAVDWQCAVWLNGALLGEHSGGYDGFSFDITRHLNKNGAANELIVFAYVFWYSSSQVVK